MQMRRIFTFAMIPGITFMALSGIMPGAHGGTVRAGVALDRRAWDGAGGGAAPGITAAAARGPVARPRAAAAHLRGAAPVAGRMKPVRFDGYVLDVPAGWPVYRLDRDPGRCVRYDQHAVYLGRPGADQQCPAHVVGRTVTISVQATPGTVTGSAAGSAEFGGPVIAGLPGARGAVTADPAGDVVRASVAGTGLSITGTYSGSPRQALSIIRSVRPQPAAHQPAAHQPAAHQPAAHSRWPAAARPTVLTAARPTVLTAAWPPAAQPGHPRRHQPGRAARPHPRHHRRRHHLRRHARPPARHHPARHRPPRHHPARHHPARHHPARHHPAGRLAARPLHGFDSCAAPSVAVMRAFRRVFAAAAIYIGGAEQGCAQPNLTAAWVRTVTRLGYALMPTYVGPQASCSRYSVRIVPSRAAAQGRAAAVDAIASARALGMGPGTPLYYDLEDYNGYIVRCRTASLDFLNAWTRALHARGYRSGIYSSVTPGVASVGAAIWMSGHPMARPDSVWFGLWDGRRNLAGSPWLLAAWWSGPHRTKQYLGPHLRTVGGHTVDIDSDWVNGSVYR
jgi:hypothetical protein